MIKVCHIITQDIWIERGGAQINTEYTWHNLDDKVFDADILSERELFSMKRTIRPLWDFLCVFEIMIWFFFFGKPQIVHTHCPKAGIIGRWAAWLYRVPVIIHTHHGLSFNPYQPFYARWFYIFCEWITSWITTKQIFVSKADMETARRLGICRDGVLIRSGIKKPEARTAKFDGDIVWVGNKKKQKNFKQAAEIAFHVYPHKIFRFYGLEERRSEESRRQTNIRCMGYTTDTDKIFKNASYILTSSKWEGLPRAILEAMIRGVVPVSVNKLPCLEEIGVNSNGTYPINAFNEEMWTKESHRVQEIAAREEFNIDFMVRQIEKLYEECLARRKP